MSRLFESRRGVRAAAACCPPAFLVELAVLRPDELLLSHIAACESCRAIYERSGPRAKIRLDSRLSQHAPPSTAPISATPVSAAS